MLNRLENHKISEQGDTLSQEMCWVYISCDVSAPVKVSLPKESFSHQQI